MTKVLQKPLLSKLNFDANKNISMLLFPELDFATTKYCFDEYAKAVNERLKKEYEANPSLTKEFIRAQHSELFYILIRLFRKQISDNNYKYSANAELRVMDPSNPPMLQTSNTEIQNKLEGLVNLSTVYRQMKRLEKHGIIVQKVLHGHKYRYEIALNPEILVLFDKANQGYLPQNELLRTAYGNQLLSYKIANCKVSSVLENDSINKEINKRSNLLGFQQSTSKSQVQTDPNKFGIVNENDSFFNDSRETSEIAAANQKNMMGGAAPEGASGNDLNKQYQELIFKKDKTIQHLRKMAAIRLLVMYFNILMKYSGSGKTIEFENELQREKTLEYLEKKYFAHCQTQESIANSFVKYEWCVNKAEEIVKFRRNKGQNGFIQYARAWFDNENYDGGFIGLFSKHEDWAKRNRIKNQTRADRRRKVELRAKYNEVINRYMRNQITYTQLDNYVKNNVAEYYPLMQAEMVAGGLKRVNI